MASSKVRAPDGTVITVEHEAGASPEQIKQLARQQRPMRMAETVKGPVKNPYGESTVGSRLKARAPDLAASAATLPIGGPGLLPFAGRVLASEAAGDVTGAALGQKVTPGYHGAASIVGEGIAKGLGTALSPKTYGAFAQRTAKQAADWLKDKVPAFTKFASDEKGLYEIAHKTGPRVLSKDFDAALKKIVPQAQGIEVSLPVEDLKGLGLTPRVVIQLPTATSGPAPLKEMGVVDAGHVIEAVTGKWSKNPGLYRRTVDALTPELDKLNLGQSYADAREAYKVGAGFVEFAERGKFLYGERYDPVRAMQALDKHGRALFRRGMDEFAAIVRGPGEKPVEAVKAHPWTRRIEGALVGGAAGVPLGIPHAVTGAAGGLAAANALPRTTYRNVPTADLRPFTPALDFARRVPYTEPAKRLGRALVGEGVREGARELGVPDVIEQARERK